MRPALAQVRTQARQQQLTIGAPLGMNVVDNAGALPPGDAVALVNVIRDQYGTRSRSGFREWVTGLGTTVRTVSGFQGSTGTEDRLFAGMQDAIYDCTATSATPSAVYTFGTADANSGKLITAAFTTQSGVHYLLVADETNGYLHYNETGDVWTKPVAGAGAGEVDGVDPDDIVFVMVWKKRVWFVARDSSTAYYLPVDQITGTVAPFPFGQLFKHGGTLVGLYSWTRAAGDGLDDILVAISSAGDVVAYQGTDPSDYTQITPVGVNYIGAVPAGRRLALDVGGELVIMSSLGLIPASRLFAEGGAIAEDAYVSLKISPLLGQELAERGTSYGWDLKLHPGDKTLVIMTPATSGDREQWVMSLNNRGWAQHFGVPMNAIESWKGKLYFGTTDGRVCINDGDVDENQLGGSTNATAIECSILTGFSDGGSPQLKRPSQARPRFMTTGTSPQFQIEARYDYDRTEVGSIAYVAATGAGLWDSAIWDSDVWGSGVGTSGEWRGLTGMGSTVAIALKWASVARVTLTEIAMTYTVTGRVM